MVVDECLVVEKARQRSPAACLLRSSGHSTFLPHPRDKPTTQTPTTEMQTLGQAPGPRPRHGAQDRPRGPRELRAGRGAAAEGGEGRRGRQGRGRGERRDQRWGKARRAPGLGAAAARRGPRAHQHAAQALHLGRARAGDAIARAAGDGSRRRGGDGGGGGGGGGNAARRPFPPRALEQEQDEGTVTEEQSHVRVQIGGLAALGLCLLLPSPFLLLPRLLSSSPLLVPPSSFPSSWSWCLGQRVLVVDLPFHSFSSSLLEMHAPAHPRPPAPAAPAPVSGLSSALRLV